MAAVGTLGHRCCAARMTTVPSKRTPSKLVSMMKLTTPATASAPYTDDAPPVRTSTRLISADGMTFRSAARLGAVRVARHQATAVDENQRALRTEVAKVDVGGTRCTVRNARSLSGPDRRQLVQHVFDAGRTGQLDVLVGDDRDGRRRSQGSAAECACR